MNVNLFKLPGDLERVGVMTTTDDVFVGDVLRPTLPDIEMVTGVKRWRVIGLHGSEADAVACL